MLKALGTLLSFRYSGLLGLLWTINYVFILVANPYVSNGAQVILTQMQTLIVWALNVFMFRLKIKWWKHILIAVMVAAGVSAVFDSSFTNIKTLGGLREIAICIVYIFNTFANGVSNVMLEAQYEVFFPDESDTSQQLGLSKKEFAVLVNVAYNFWSIIFWLPFFWVGLIPNQYYIFNVDIWSMGHVYFLGMCLCTWIYTIGANFLIYQESSLYAAVAGSITAVLQAAFFCLPLGQFRSIPDIYTWITVGATSAASLAYASWDDKKNKDQIAQSTFYRMYTSWMNVDVEYEVLN